MPTSLLRWLSQLQNVALARSKDSSSPMGQAGSAGHHLAGGRFRLGLLEPLSCCEGREHERALWPGPGGHNCFHRGWSRVGLGALGEEVCISALLGPARALYRMATVNRAVGEDSEDFESRWGVGFPKETRGEGAGAWRSWPMVLMDIRMNSSLGLPCESSGIHQWVKGTSQSKLALLSAP